MLKVKITIIRPRRGHLSVTMSFRMCNSIAWQQLTLSTHLTGLDVNLNSFCVYFMAQIQMLTELHCSIFYLLDTVNNPTDTM